MGGWTYILECSDGTLYVGSTTWLEARMRQHADGKGSSYTRRRLPVRLIWAAHFDRIDDAFALEKRLQKWSRAKKVAFMEARLLQLPELSARGTKPSRVSISTAHFPQSTSADPSFPLAEEARQGRLEALRRAENSKGRRPPSASRRGWRRSSANGS
jgi:putative endonuclease